MAKRMTQYQKQCLIELNAAFGYKPTFRQYHKNGMLRVKYCTWIRVYLVVPQHLQLSYNNLKACANKLGLKVVDAEGHWEGLNVYIPPISPVPISSEITNMMRKG